MDFDRMIHEHHPLICKVCRVYSDAAHFDDVYQEILINLWQGVQRFRGESKVSTWIYRVAINTAISQHRKLKRSSSLFTGEIPDIPTEGGPKIEEEEEINRLYSAIRRLNETDRAIILLYLEENKYEEIAEITGLSASNVGVRINRIKKKLSRMLS